MMFFVCRCADGRRVAHKKAAGRPSTTGGNATMDASSRGRPGPRDNVTAG
jgi:hypothetical protein